MQPALRSCQRGAVAVMTAMVLPVLLGFTSLGVEVGHWYLTQREMQGSADAAALSAAAQYVADKGTGTSYQTVGQSYAFSNDGFVIPTSNVCVATSSGNNCGSVLALDSRPIPGGCTASGVVCIIVEITQDTSLWVTTKASLEPIATGKIGKVQAIPTPTLKARSVVALVETIKTETTNGSDCILTLANATNALQVEGGGDLVAKCGVAVDGGLDQNSGTPVLGGITFNGNGSKVEVTTLAIAANQTESQECVNGNGQHCYLWDQNFPQGGSTTPLPAADFKPSTPTIDPYASQIAAMFQSGGSGVPPLGVCSVTTINPPCTAPAVHTAGSGYTNGTRIFTVQGGNYTSPAKIVATVSGGHVTAILGVYDPGAYKTLPGTFPAGTPDTGGGSGATFSFSEGCFTWPGTTVGGVAWTPIPGRKYCSIFMHGTQTVNFATGNYWIAGGDTNCVGFCTSGSNVVVTSDVAGVSFFLTNGEGNGAFGRNSYATVSIQSGRVNLCSPGTNCGTTCINSISTSCMLFIQNPAATLSSGLKTISNIFNGNGKNTLSGLIYLPRQTFQTTGTSVIGGCFGVIAYYVDIGGTPTFSNGCLPGNGIGGGTTTVTTFSPPSLFM